MAKVTHLGEDIQVCNAYYEGRLSNYKANYASSCKFTNKDLIKKFEKNRIPALAL
ncbi:MULTISPECIES: hypothetical protein [unclassified Nostoc]|uniref:hypothetical protein n=1 Tax=unclassified Nostoc TaxID=2593658 RepID=UPI00260F72B0|nr:hypothetical protein [Nostoc sp. S13]MDF5739902.1 hypothetical protein [Nostoc sp. S13]